MELRKQWRKSSYSAGNGGACVEVAETASRVLVRDTRHRELGHLEFGHREWAGLLRAVKTGRL
ncbi:DUF397 domain-containing protein [Thermobifida cellulosilytica]|uniref:DUF397 domain-containing protein n=1 Tax=Thermobifida cellulosilytica TB100 TaxID=665004 RepID=A0A147KJJ1_THECS|nr:DUF397 domain-containing protein [Thermobifida cellulosilytica]KUP97462.1 hypothetical protein AC529_06345 [Thermobifida cellulosilytica TB100]